MSMYASQAGNTSLKKSPACNSSRSVAALTLARSHAADQTTRHAHQCPRQHTLQEMAATAADVSNAVETREVIAPNNRSDLTVCLCGHRRVENRLASTFPARYPHTPPGNTLSVARRPVRSEYSIAPMAVQNGSRPNIWTSGRID